MQEMMGDYQSFSLILFLLALSLPSDAFFFVPTVRNYHYVERQIPYSGDKTQERWRIWHSFSIDSILWNSNNEITDGHPDGDRMWSRRNALIHAAAVAGGTSIVVQNAIAFDMPFAEPPPMGPAKRPTSYIVDGTIPPTLLPLKGSTERSLIRSLALGSGSAKTPKTDESINLNNFMNKGVFGAIGKANDLLGTEKSTKKKDATFVVLGMRHREDGGDLELALRLLGDLVDPRAKKGMATAVAVSFLPINTQPLLDQFSSNQLDASSLLRSLDDQGISYPRTELTKLLEFTKKYPAGSLDLIAPRPSDEDLSTTKTNVLQSVPEGRRNVYVADVQGFISQTQDPKFRLYTDRSMMRQIDPSAPDRSFNATNINPADFFAQKILEDEAIATGCSRWAVLRKESMVILLNEFQDTRFDGGAIQRIPRIFQFMKPNANVNKECVTSILLNPTAKETLSQSRFIRLEIGTAPENMEYQTKVADFLFFSKMPKVNMLARMMNPI